MDIEFNRIVREIELRSLMDINKWRDFTKNEKAHLTKYQQQQLLFLCPNNFNILEEDSFNRALEEKNKLLEEIDLG